MTAAGEGARGLVMVLTGHGKGKTTAATGLAVRASAAGLRVLWLQFVKGTWNYGELETLRGLPGVDVERMTAGYSWEPDRFEEDKKLAAATLKRARRAIEGRTHDLVVLDDVNYVVHYRLLKVDEVVDLLRRRPSRVHVVLTGRNAAPEVLEAADQVTETTDVRHHFRAGVMAQRGIEY